MAKYYVSTSILGETEGRALILKSRRNILPYWAKMNQISVLLYRAKQFKRRFFCRLRKTRSKLMSVICHRYIFFDTFLDRQTNLKSMFSP